jgi:hypothetical protein
MLIQSNLQGKITIASGGANPLPMAIGMRGVQGCVGMLFKTESSPGQNPDTPPPPRIPARPLSRGEYIMLIQSGLQKEITIVSGSANPLPMAIGMRGVQGCVGMLFKNEIISRTKS